MEDYKEKYEMALEGIQEILDSGEDSIKMSRLKLRLQGIFPELKESEEEEARKELVEWLKSKLGNPSIGFNPAKMEKWIAYLEKLKDFDKQLEQAYKTADEVQYNRGYQDAMDEMERNRLTSCENQTEAEAKREMDFAMDFFKKNKRQPTYSDCIEETRRKMMKEVTKWLDDNASLYFNVYWDKKEWIFENGKLNADLKKSMGL